MIHTTGDIRSKNRHSVFPAPRQPAREPIVTPAPRLRFAPSPTGHLHVGGGRTALFNWLYARRYGGVFVLRIEDTDAARSSREMIEGILDGLRWLGLDWDEGPDVGGSHAPYFQSERFDRHRAVANQLVQGRRAYYCECDADLLRREREAAKQEGREWKYDRRCLAKPTAFEGAPNRARAVRFLVPDGHARVDDLVHGPIEFDYEHIEDFVLVRSDGQPTYQLSVVVDDMEMAITHVVRGDDHISNTPKQALLYSAIGAPLPAFAHVPLILGSDKKRLSKRHGATSVAEYRRLGYLPEAMVNFLALLGWSPGSNQELFSHEELIHTFSLEGISGSSAVFDPEKLDWLNGQHLSKLGPDELARRLEPMMREASLWHEAFADERREWFQRALELLKPRARRLGDFVERGRYLFSDDVSYAPAAVAKHLAGPGLAGHVEALATAFERVNGFDPAALEHTLRSVAEARQVKAATLIHAARVAVTGEAVSPSLFDVLALVGRERTLVRLGALTTFLRARQDHA